MRAVRCVSRKCQRNRLPLFIIPAQFARHSSQGDKKRIRASVSAQSMYCAEKNACGEVCFKKMSTKQTASLHSPCPMLSSIPGRQKRIRASVSAHSMNCAEKHACGEVCFKKMSTKQTASLQCPSLILSSLIPGMCMDQVRLLLCASSV